ncbi:unnamed protein product [Ostreobium quekettii]|uniref:Uncharacterized protein n=1 Tax=Ostreobium quekettii TaxID=121088 RepID=A0A8S1JFZ0_9CHLO|nr:unnamed protein product [Ostreobium quekettii]
MQPQHPPGAGYGQPAPYGAQHPQQMYPTPPQQPPPMQPMQPMQPGNPGLHQTHTTMQSGYPHMPAMQPGAGMGTASDVDGFFSSVATNYIGSQFLQGGQSYVQRVQQRMGWLSGSLMNYYFAISGEYVQNKLLMLAAPYLRRWSYSRLPEQIAGGPKYRPPRADVNCPDLYIPLMAFFTYCWLACLPGVHDGKFSPDLMYARAYRGLIGWIVLFLVLKCMVYAMSLPSSLPMLEAIAFSGYAFVQLSIMALATLSGGEPPLLEDPHAQCCGDP